MKQCYYSSELNKYFDSEQECIDAENALHAEKEKAEKAKQEREASIRKEKKELVTRIEDAEKALDNARLMYDKAQQEASDIMSEARKKAREVLSSARGEVNTANENRFKAIADFNKKFGTYTTTYSGEKATEEFVRIQKLFDSFWNSLPF